MRRISFSSMWSGSTSKADKAAKEEKIAAAASSSSASSKPEPVTKAKSNKDLSKVTPRWKEARDPKTGRQYYYDVVTRSTQWHKPNELLAPAERDAKQREKDQQRQFFSEMERNMRRNFEEGHLSTDVVEPKSFHGLAWQPPSRPSSASMTSSVGDARALRTLSTIDDSMIEDAYNIGGFDNRDRSSLTLLTQEVKGHHRRRSLSPRSQAWSREITEIKEASKLKDIARAEQNNNVDALADQLARADLSRNRNSTGTMYVDHTLDEPDKEATIRCVCHVLRAHMAAADAMPRARAESLSRTGEFAVFEDEEYTGNEKLPSAQRLTTFYREVFSRGQMELECIVTSLIYVERVLRAARGRLKLRASNWRPILFAAMVMASKVCDDLSMWNADFGHICKGFNLQRINALESGLLKAYGYNATVPASEYAKYYFHLRSMAARLGLAGDFASMAGPKPLNVQRAKDVAARSRAKYGDTRTNKEEELTLSAETIPVRRAVSLGGTGGAPDLEKQSRTKPRNATLEQVVDMAPTSSPTARAR